MIWLLIFFAVAIALAWRPASLHSTTITLGVLLFFFSLFGPAAWGWDLLLWLIFGGIAAALNLANFRREWISRPLLRWAKTQLPSLSRTEEEALSAGTVWWEGELFRGRPDWHQWLSVPTPGLSPDEQAFLDGPVEKFCAMLKDWEINFELADLPPKAWELIKQERFFAMVIPKRYGGLGFSAAAHAAVLAKIGSAPAGITAGSIVAVPNSLGPAELLLKYGTEEQKDHYLPRLASGQDIPCFALTAPTAGSDAGAIPDTAVVCRGQWEGNEVIGLRLNWDKRYITLAPVATLLGLAVKLVDPDGLIGDDPAPGITCCLVPTSTPGVEIGRRHRPLAATFMNGPTRGEDVFVPLDAIIGGPDMAGRGWQMLNECLAVGRAVSLPSGSHGTMLAMSRTSGAYSRVRQQFGRPVGDFEGVAEALGRIGGRTYAVAAVSRITAGAVDLGEKPAVASAIAKFHCTDLMRQASLDAMDIHGGKGVMLGPKNWLASIFQSAPIYTTVEGANILTRSMIIFGQGALRCHPYLPRELVAIRDDDEAAFDALLFEHLGWLTSVKVRCFVHALTGSLLAPAPKGSPVAGHFRRVARYSAALAFLSDILAVSLGNQLKLREALSGRMGDVLSWLYIASAALKRFEEEGRQADDRPLIDWCCHTAFRQCETALDGVLRHLPSRWLAAAVRLVLFPLGRHARPPRDADLFAIAKIMQTRGPARDRLLQGSWDGKRTPAGQLEACLQAVEECESLERRLDRAETDGQLSPQSPDRRIASALEAGILSQGEAEALGRCHALINEIIAVDEFPANSLARRKPGTKRTRTTRKSASTAS